MTIHPVILFNSFEHGPMARQHFLPAVDPLLGQEQIEIIPERHLEFSLSVEVIQQLQIGLEPCGRGVEGLARDPARIGAGPKSLDALWKVLCRRADGVRGHQRVAGSSRAPAPFFLTFGIGSFYRRRWSGGALRESR